jgi:hypothetical protein
MKPQLLFGNICFLQADVIPGKERPLLGRVLEAWLSGQFLRGLGGVQEEAPSTLDPQRWALAAGGGTRARRLHLTR